MRHQILRHPGQLLGRSRPQSTGFRLFSTTSQPVPGTGYAATLPNLRIGRHTRVIFQGFTGRQATANAQESLAWGTQIVGGVKPGFEGEHLGLPVLPSVRRAMEVLKPDATGIYVPAALAPAAIEEAIEAEVPLVVAVAEHIPLHSMLRIHAMLRSQSKTRLVGANCPGIISAVGQCRIGFQPLPCFMPGKVGIAAKSGTLSYEAVASTTRAGLGQSLCIGVGGDIVAGTDLLEALTVLEQDPDTEAIALIGEIGGSTELEAASWIRDYNARSTNPKPIVALIAGHQSPPGHIMGHAGAFRLPGEPSTQEKVTALEEAGVTIIDHPETFGRAIKARLDDPAATSRSSRSSLSAIGNKTPAQRRGVHTSSRPSLGGAFLHRPTPSIPQRHFPEPLSQKRTIYLSQAASFELLRQQGFNVAAYSGYGSQRYLTLTIDRTAKSPCVLASPAPLDSPDSNLRRFPFDYNNGLDGLLASRVADHLQLGVSGADPLRRFLASLYELFLKHEAFLLETTLVLRLGEVKVVDARLGLDDVSFYAQQLEAAGGGEATVDATIACAAAVLQNPATVEAKKSGIVYIPLGTTDDSRAIGTLVNGAGLAMNTVDALAVLGGQATNFLDTGGKATSETVNTCFKVLLQDSRTKVIFVNVFGGLTLGDMIARGVLLAFKETKVRVPVVVRIRGTNEAEGQKLIQDSGLPLYAFDEFEEAATKAIELAQQQYDR